MQQRGPPHEESIGREGGLRRGALDALQSGKGRSGGHGVVKQHGHRCRRLPDLLFKTCLLYWHSDTSSNWYTLALLSWSNTRDHNALTPPAGQLDIIRPAYDGGLMFFRSTSR